MVAATNTLGTQARLIDIWYKATYHWDSYWHINWLVRNELRCYQLDTGW